MKEHTTKQEAVPDLLAVLLTLLAAHRPAFRQEWSPTYDGRHGSDDVLATAPAIWRSLKRAKVQGGRTVARPPRSASRLPVPLDRRLVALELFDWDFDIVPTSVLDARERSQDSITRPSLRKLVAAVTHSA